MAITDRFKGVPKSEQRGKRWIADYTNSSGKRVPRRFDTKAEAEAWLGKQMRLKRSGSEVDTRAAQRMTLAQLWPSFLDRLKAGGARGGSPAGPKTLTNYQRAWSYIEPRWGTAPLASIRYAEISNWVDTMQSVQGGPASAATRHEVAKKFRTLLDHAVRERLLSHNPATDATNKVPYLPRVTKTKPHVYLSMDQLQSLASHCRGYEPLILIAGLCGLRFGEVTALQPQDVTLGKRPSVHVSRAYSDNKGTLTLGRTKTGLERTVPLPRSLADMLAPLVADRDPDARLFDAPQGGAIRHGSFTKPGSRYAKAVEAAAAAAAAKGETFPRPTFHDLRHTAVSLHIRAGSNVKVVQRIAGHQTATLTLDTYAGLFDDDLHESAARVDASFNKSRDAS